MNDVDFVEDIPAVIIDAAHLVFADHQQKSAESFKILVKLVGKTPIDL